MSRPFGDERPARKPANQPDDGPKPGEIVTIKEAVRVLIDQKELSFSVVLADDQGTGMPSRYRAADDDATESQQP